MNSTWPLALRPRREATGLDEVGLECGEKLRDGVGPAAAFVAHGKDASRDYQDAAQRGPRRVGHATTPLMGRGNVHAELGVLTRASRCHPRLPSVVPLREDEPRRARGSRGDQAFSRAWPRDEPREDPRHHRERAPVSRFDVPRACPCGRDSRVWITPKKNAESNAAKTDASTVRTFLLA